MHDLVVTITDTGVGMTPDDLGKIFEKYKQSKSKSFRGGAGTGLGLYIVKQIIEAHGGSITVRAFRALAPAWCSTCPCVALPDARNHPRPNCQHRADTAFEVCLLNPHGLAVADRSRQRHHHRAGGELLVVSDAGEDLLAVKREESAVGRTRGLP